jgi:hypothetical protein
MYGADISELCIRIQTRRCEFMTSTYSHVYECWLYLRELDSGGVVVVTLAHHFRYIHLTDRLECG